MELTVQPGWNGLIISNHLLEFTYLDDISNILRIIEEKIQTIKPEARDQFDLNIKLNLSKAWATKTKLAVWQEIAKERGGKCFSAAG